MTWLWNSVHPHQVHSSYNWEDPFIDPRVVLCFRGTSTGWGNGLTGISWSSTRGSAKFYTWGKITPDTHAHWGPTSWKLASHRNPWRWGRCSHGHQVEQEPAILSGSKEGQQFSGHCQQVEVDDPSSLLSTSETHL